MVKRIVFDFFLICAIFYLPWWLVAVIAVFGIFYFHSYYEVLVAGILLDILYSVSGNEFSVFSVLGFLTAIILFVAIERIKCELR